MFREDWLSRESQDHEGFKTGLDFTFVEVPWVSPTVGGSFTLKTFENNDPFFGVRRLDRNYEGHIEFAVKALDIFGGSPVIRYTYHHATSNHPLFDYDEHGLSIGFKAITF